MCSQNVAVGSTIGQNQCELLAEKALEFYKALTEFLPTPENAAGTGTEDKLSVLFDDDIEEEEEAEWNEEETEGW